LVSETPTAEVMVYASFSKCGCIAAMTVDLPGYAKDTAKTVAGWIRSGHEVRRISDAEVRQAMATRQPKWGPCIHAKPQQATLLSTKAGKGEREPDHA
jgi:hypothetical protein